MSIMLGRWRLPAFHVTECSIHLATALAFSAGQNSICTWRRQVSGKTEESDHEAPPNKNQKAECTNVGKEGQGNRFCELRDMPMHDIKTTERMQLASADMRHLSTEIHRTAYDEEDAVKIKSSGLDGKGSLDTATKLKVEFDAALQCLKQMPSALKDIPKMNPCGIYANHNLRLDRIAVYGFDYDYTLAQYTAGLQELIYDLAKEYLVLEHRYPDSCLKFKYDRDFPIRGLYYDRRKGYLLKLDFFHCVEPGSCYFGRRRISRSEIEEAYGGNHISAENLPNLIPLMDLFCLSEVCLISDVIQHFANQKLEFDASYVYEDVKRSVEYVHKSGLLHRKILDQPAKYLVKSDGMVQFLQSLKKSGKKLFILTNSPFRFVDGGMRFMFEDDGIGGVSWRTIFDVVIALADKPNFYTSERPFRYYDPAKDNLAFSRVEEFAKQGVYYHGCLKHFLEITKWRGPEVLYFGDHLYSDLRGPAKAGWRTAAVIRELEREIEMQNDVMYRFEQAKYHVMQELLGKFHGLTFTKAMSEEEMEFLISLRNERQNARRAMKSIFNQNFGSAFLTDTGKESAFSYNVQRYADIYTSKLENFLYHSFDSWFYSPSDVKILPHHIKVSPSTLLMKNDKIAQTV